MRKRVLHLLLFVFVIAFPLSADSAEPIFPGLSKAELQGLAGGIPVVRAVESFSRLAIPALAPGASELLGELSSMKPNYLTEVMAIVPVGATGADISRFTAALYTIENYPKIPYYSKQWKKEFPLFDSMRILEQGKTEDGRTTAKVELVMMPFESFSARYEWKRYGDTVAFSCVNATPLVYRGIRAVQPGNMVWRIIMYQVGDNIVFYGIGAVKAFDLFGALRDRLEPSFVGRTEAFLSYMLRQLNG